MVLRERGPLPLEEGVSLVASVAAAIDHAAARGVHHGSLHPRDIVLSADGVRVIGFGIAAAVSKVGTTLPRRPPYSSPDAPSDVFSLGAMAFEAMMGRHPSPDSLDELEAEHGPAFRRAFTAAFAANPRLRPARAGDFAAALKGAALLGAPQAPQARESPEFNAGALDRFTDAGVTLDLPIDLPAEISIDAEERPADRMGASPVSFPAPWTAQPPTVFHTAGPSPERGSRRWLVAVLVLIGIGLSVAVGYFVTSRAAPPDAASEPAVAATTVDLPANPPVPPAAPTPPPRAPASTASRLPAATPSRQASGAVAPRKTLARGSLLIRSTPADADVVVNGQARGKTPLTVRDLPLGSYTIRVAREGYAAEDRQLQLTAQRPTASVTFGLREMRQTTSGPGELNVQSRPAGARVFVNNRLIGSTPLAIPDLPAGPATVRIEMDGYTPWITTVRVNAGESTRVAASLDRK
jgi:hypothetical protein